MSEKMQAAQWNSGMAALFGLLFASSVQAQSGKLLTPYADFTYTHDSNIFRTADDIPDEDGARRGDSSVRGVVGLAFEKELSRQKITARAGIAQSKYSHFKFLDYDARDMQANLNWRLGSHVWGNIGTSSVKTLAPYTEFRDSERNLRLQKNQNADMAWLFHPSWRVRASVTRNDVSYELESQKFKDRRLTTVEAGLDYLSASGNQLGVLLRKGKEQFPNAEVLKSLNLINDQNTQELKIRLDWRFSGKTHLQVLAGVVKREHQVRKERDYQGANGRVTLNWYPTGKLEMIGAVWHEIDTTDNLTTNYATSDGVRFAPSYKISSKMKLDALLRFEKRVPVGIAGVTLRQVDKFSTANLSLTYVPISKMQLVTTLSHEVLSSNLALRSYRANSISFNAHYEY